MSLQSLSEAPWSPVSSCCWTSGGAANPPGVIAGGAGMWPGGVGTGSAATGWVITVTGLLPSLSRACREASSTARYAARVASRDSARRSPSLLPQPWYIQTTSDTRPKRVADSVEIWCALGGAIWPCAPACGMFASSVRIAADFRCSSSRSTRIVIDVTPPHDAAATSCPANYSSLFQSHLEAAFLTRVDQSDRQRSMPWRVDEVMPQHHPTDTGMRAKVRRGVRPGHLCHLIDAPVDETGELAELRTKRHHRARGGRAHDELGEQPGVAEVDAHVDVVERHVDRIAVGGLADQHACRPDRQLVVTVGDRADAVHRRALPAEETRKPARCSRIRQRRQQHRRRRCLTGTNADASDRVVRPGRPPHVGP